MDFEQAALLQVRRGDAPAAQQIAVEAVAEDVAEGPFSILLFGKAGARRDRPGDW